MSLDPYAGADISDRRRAIDTAVLGVLGRATATLANHWLLVMNALTALLTGVAFLAPYLQSIGLYLPARAIYFFYSFMCHQMASRSYFAFGFQVAQCHRNTAIYAAMFLAGLSFALLRHRARLLDWRIYALLITPMAIDGGTQLLGWRESDWLLRTITGALFGAASVWFAYPYVDRFVRIAARRSEPKVHRVVLFTKNGCSLCDKAKVMLTHLADEFSIVIEEVDITQDAAIFQRYQNLIPVIQIDGRVAAVTKVSEVWLRRYFVRV